MNHGALDMAHVKIKLTKVGQPRDYIIRVDDDGSGKRTELGFENDEWEGNLPAGERVLDVFVSGEKGEGLRFEVSVNNQPRSVPSIIIPVRPNVRITRTLDV